MKTCYFILFFLATICTGFSQTKNFIDQPFIETIAKADTAVTPDRIYLLITIAENDARGKRSVEELETEMTDKLKSLDINPETQLTLSDLSSGFSNHFLRKQDIYKTKNYELLVYDARTAGLVIVALEETGISNISLGKVEYSEMESLKLQLRSSAVERAKLQAEAMTRPLGQSVGKAIFISDTNTRIIDVLQGRIVGVQSTGLEMQRTETTYTPTPIDFGKIRVESELQVKFALD
ncbi:SIMPL domain-containing protein [Sinomicrobium kalidii]|uniref:SIMPL domain-containing protein n=1 Tax=Sinomicrobium kalidii TaxID=2900738 RepID=UPI001E577D2D|nr:SIMPL domain-containing protein [Sinomicrobium kalidii]UGU17878.1 SIMPL domain-containing protein [Sinomicrobium kalidii]